LFSEIARFQSGGRKWKAGIHQFIYSEHNVNINW